MIVTTKEQLKKAHEAGAKEIIIEGELAKKVHQGKSIVKIGAITMGILTVGVAAIPFTGGLSMAVATTAAAPIVALTGMEIAVIIAVIFVGAALLLAIWKDYEEIEYSSGPPV